MSTQAVERNDMDIDDEPEESLENQNLLDLFYVESLCKNAGEQEREQLEHVRGEVIRMTKAFRVIKRKLQEREDASKELSNNTLG